MLRLRKILLLDYLYISITLLVLLITIFRLSIPINSNYNESSTSFTGIITKIIIKEDKVTLYVKNKETVIATYYDSKCNFKLGDKVKVLGEFKLPNTNTSDYLFDYRKYLKNRRIFYLIEVSSIKRIESNNNIYYYLKQKLIDRLDYNPYLFTFILGDKSYLDSSIKRSYQSNGISHLFCISGMHTALLISIISRLLKRFKLNENNSFIVTTIILVIYLFLVGLSPSILRAVLFYIIFSINRINYFYIKPTNLFFLVLSISLLVNPYYIYDVGYLYSYSISFALIKMLGFLQTNNYFKTLFKTSILSLLISLPITLYNFYEINILSIFYNLIFIPIISLIIFPLSLLVVIIKPLIPIYNLLIKIIEDLSLLFSKISLGKLLFKRLPITIYIIYFIIIIIYLYKPKRLILLVLFFLLTIHFFIPYFDSNFLKVIDVGQGDSSLIHYNHKNILIDTGGITSYYKKTDGIVFNNTLSPLLKSSGIKRINYLILTHGDYDHMGEAINIIENYKVDKVIFNCGDYNYLEKELIRVLNKKNIKYYTCINELNVSNNKFYFLQTIDFDDENDNSNVIYTELNNYRFLFMGDASTRTEEEIIKEYNLPKIDALKVGHHGSKTSSSEEFINTIKPKYSIISVGKDNKFKHPNKEALENLSNSRIYRTDKDGTLTIAFNNKLKIETSLS